MQQDLGTTLNRILARDMHSLLQYLGDAEPWTAASEQATLDRLRALRDEEARFSRKLAEWMAAHRIRTAIGRFPEEFSETHFLALDHLLPRLVAFERWSLAELRNDQADVADPEARTLVADLVAIHERHLAELERLAGQYAGKPVSTLR